jgi:D-glycero-D-manno-heptose 1,7-bisphosphate phosphatase
MAARERRAPRRQSTGGRAVFLDRDGTINVERDYLTRPDQLELLPGAADAIRLLNERGLPVFIASNQSGVARGYLTLRTLGQIHRKLRLLLRREGAAIDRIYYCPGHPDEQPPCRKPRTGMAEQARREFGITPSRCYTVGDSKVDMEFGRNLGGKTVLVLTGHAQGDEPWIKTVGVDCIAHDLLGAARWIIDDLKRS